MLTPSIDFGIGIVLGAGVVVLLYLLRQPHNSLSMLGSQWALRMNLQWVSGPNQLKSSTEKRSGESLDNNYTKWERGRRLVSESINADTPSILCHTRFLESPIRRRTLLLRLKIFSRLLFDPLVIHNPSRYYEILHSIETIQTELMLLESQVEIAPTIQSSNTYNGETL